MHACFSIEYAARAKCGNTRRRCFSTANCFARPVATASCCWRASSSAAWNCSPIIAFHGRIDESGWAAVIGAMTPLLARARSAEALLLGLDSLEELLAGNGFASKSPGDELSNRPIEESGA